MTGIEQKSNISGGPIMRQRFFAVSILAILLATAFPAAAQQTTAPRQDRFARLMARVDADHDGFIEAAEAQAFAAARFAKLDKAHRGYLTLDDWEASLRRALDRASETRRPRLERALSSREAAFRAMNKAGDGKLTKAEFLADSAARFAAADTNKDGKLSLDELRAAKGHAF
jgi:Ca2+-binding EF-hand superfamily protein